jgi:hypothetical protein
VLGETAANDQNTFMPSPKKNASYPITSRFDRFGDLTGSVIEYVII